MRSQGSRKMIFSSIFAPKWKSKKVEQRLLAVSQLDTAKAKEQAVLNQLAQSDSDEKVRLAALKRINDIKLWWQVYKQENKSLIGKTAENEIINNLNVADLTQEQLAVLIQRIDKPSQLATLFPLVNDFEQRVSLLKRIGKKPLIIETFSNANESEQVALLPLMEQFSLQKSIQEHAKQAVNDKLVKEAEAAALAKTKPIEVANETKMVLAKLNALRDKFDYQEVTNKQKALIEQWQAIELSWLTDTKDTTEKFQQIELKLNAHVEQLAQVYQKEQAKLERERRLTQATSEYAELKTNAESDLANLLLDPNKASVYKARASIKELSGKLKVLEQLGVSDKVYSDKVDKLIRQVSEVEAVIEELPEVAALIAKGKTLEIAPDFDALERAELAKDEWYNQVTKATLLLPVPLQKDYSKQIKELVAQWKANHKQLFKELNEKQQGAFKLIKDIKRLIEAGRFKVCFGIFKGLKQDYSALPESSRTKLKSDFEAIEKKLNEVNEWHREISLPKRHEILAELKEKIEQAAENINERSEWIKLTRKRWNELGYIATEEEKTLDEVFNQQLEQAFLPCREFYAVQEKQREANAEKRKNVIAQYQELSETLPEIELKEVEKRFKQLKQLWREAGDVDNKSYKQLVGELKAFDNKIFTFIKESHKQNGVEKASLLAQAEAARENDNIDESIEALKQLQAQWKSIGFAGKSQENKLWVDFREINDQVFAKRDAARAEKRAEQETELAKLSERFDKSVSEASLSSLESLQNANLQLEQLQHKLKQRGLDKSRLNTAVFNKLKEFEKLIHMLKNSKDRIKFEALFNALESGEIPTQWQQTDKSALSRHQLTIRLEILNDLESPKTDQALRLTEQVTALQAKVNGEILDNKSLLNQWLSHGEIDEDSLKLLARIKPIFV